MLHEFENNQDTESFLKQNGKKFSQDCITAMKLMYTGVRLNGETCKHLYGFHDRRLRNCRECRPDIVKSAWKRNEKGERLYVEFWIDVPKPPTKQSVQERWLNFLDEQPTELSNQLKLSL
jgi:hypothetical protein